MTLSSDEELEKLKDEIISSMAQIEDTHHRVVLSLMIRIMSTQERFITEIYNKLDGIVQDEKRIKNIVLNGHVEMHAEHHNWIRDKIANDKEMSKDTKSFFKSLVGKILTLAIIFLLGFHAQKVFPHLFGEMNGHSNFPSTTFNKGP